MDAAETADEVVAPYLPDDDQSAREGSVVDDQPLLGLVLLAQFHGIATDADQLRHEAGRGSEPFDETGLLLAAKRLDLKAKIIRQPAERLDRVALPALALCNNGSAFVVAKVGDGKVLIHDLALQRPCVLPWDEFTARYDGRLLTVASRASLVAELAKFDFSWFIPAVVKYRKLLLEVLTVSFFLQLFALVTPLFFQVVMDKVLVHHAMTTLTVITIGLLVITLFNVVLAGLRTYVFAHTTSRIDVELGARLFRHILALPLAYFESRRVGDTIARVRELENIRNFLTGQTLTSVLDLLFTFVFLAVMFFYSGWLTLIVVISLPLYAIWSASITPTLRARLNEKFARSADNQSFLVETIAGIGTVKAMAVDPRMVRTWDNQLAGYVSAGFRVTQLANIGQQGVQLLQKLVSVAIMFWGAQMVIDGSLSVGQLIAFTMLSGQVSTPIVRLAQLWQDFQQVGISMERMGDILNTRTEAGGSRMALPPIRGRVTFENIGFRYRPDHAQVLAVLHLDRDVLQRPAVLPGIPAHRHRRALRERGGEQVIGRRAEIGAAPPDRLIAEQVMTGNLDSHGQRAALRIADPRHGPFRHRLTLHPRDHGGEAGHERLQLLAHPGVGDRALAVEHTAGARHHQPPLGPQVRAERAEHRQPVVLREQCAEPARRGADDRERAAAKNPRAVGRRARRPVDRILEYAGNAVVIFGRHQQHAIGGGDRLLERGHRLRDAFRLHVAVIERDAVQRARLQRHAIRYQLRRRAQQRGVVRAVPQAARDAEHSDHAAPPIAMRGISPGPTVITSRQSGCFSYRART